MGYGNPLFDGDQPLPSRNRKPRILSMRLWLGAVLAGTLGHGTAMADREKDDDRSHAREWPGNDRNQSH
jgi:hypothetical protein